MTMFLRSLAGLAGVAAIFAGTQVASASDVIPLKGSANVNTPTLTLGNDGQSETELARYARGGYGGGYRGGHVGHYGGYRGGYHGGHVGHYGGYRGGYYGGYRGYYGGYYGGYRGGYYGGYAGYYQPYYSSYSYSPYVYTTPYYYSSPSYYYSSPSYYSAPYYNGCCDTTANVNIVATRSVVQQPNLLNGTPYSVQPSVRGYSGEPPLNGNNNNNPPVMPPVQQGNGTYPYDGGPVAPVPMPRQDANPAKSAPAAPATLRLVTYPSQPVQQQSQFSFRAYGEDTRASGFAIDRTVPAKKTSR